MTDPEVLRWVWLLRNEIERLPMRADGNLNHKDLHQALTLATTRYIDGERPKYEDGE